LAPSVDVTITDAAVICVDRAAIVSQVRTQRLFEFWQISLKLLYFFVLQVTSHGARKWVKKIDCSVQIDKSLHGTIGRSGKGTTEEMRLQTFPKKWVTATTWHSVAECSTVPRKAETGKAWSLSDEFVAGQFSANAKKRVQITGGELERLRRQLVVLWM